MNQNNISSHLDARFEHFVETPQVVHHTLKDDGAYPNNKNLSLLVYKGTLKLPERNPAAIFEALFEANQYLG